MVLRSVSRRQTGRAISRASRTCSENVISGSESVTSSCSQSGTLIEVFTLSPILGVC